MDFSAVTWDQVLIVFLICAGSAVVGAIALFIVAARQIADVEIPQDADFFETLQIVPITVPLALDLLDMAFDVFAAPVAWIILELLGLQSLQMITVFEGLIPGTQLIPTMTVAWLVAKVMPKKERTPLREALHDYQRDQLSARRHQLQDRYRSKTLLPSGSSIDVLEGEIMEDDLLDEPPPEYFEEIEVEDHPDEW